MGIRTPDLLHAIHWQHIYDSPPPQVNVPARALPSAAVRAGCGTFLLHSLPNPSPDWAGLGQAADQELSSSAMASDPVVRAAVSRPSARISVPAWRQCAAKHSSPIGERIVRDQ